MRAMLQIFVGVLVISGGIYAGTTLVAPLSKNTEAVATSTPSISMPPQPAPEFVPSSREISGAQPPEEIPVSSASSFTVTPLCEGADTNNFDCYERHYQDLVARDGIPAAFADLKARYGVNGFVRAQCHPLTHVIGRAAAETYGTVGEAYKDGDGYCWSGYYHGVLESFADRIGLAELPKEMDAVCASVTGKERYSFDYYNCVHGMGHGVMALTQTELFQSLSLCDNLTGHWEQISCASGAYMENVIVDGLNHKTKYLDPARPLYPCDESPEKYKATCYLMQTSYMLKINGGNFKTTFEWCRDAGEQYAATCWQSLGRDASGRSTSDVARTKATCLLGENYAEQSNCVIGAVKDFISYFHADAEAKELCEALPTDLQSVCRSTAADYYRLL